MISPILYKMEIIKRLKENESYRSVLTLVTGSVISQAIPFLMTPLLTRLYPDFQFGIFFLFTSITLIVSGSACLQYDAAIVLPKDDEDALHLTILCFTISLVYSMLIGFILFIFNDSICYLFKNETIKHWFFLVPVSVFVSGINQAISAWNNRKKQYTFISANNITKSASSGTVQLVAGFGKYTNAGLIIGNLIGQITALLFQINKLYNDLQYFIGSFSLKKMLFVAKVYKKMPLYSTLSNLINNLSNQLPVFLLTRFFGINSAGYYGLSSRIVSTPMGLIGQSVSQVFIQNAAQAYHLNQNMHILLKKMYIRLFKISIIPFLLLFIFSPVIFKLLLGNNWDWHLASNISRILIPWLLVMFLNSPIVSIVNVLNKQSSLTIYTFLLLIFRFLAIWIGYLLSENLLFAIFLFSLTGLVFNIFLLFYLLNVSKNAPKP